MDLAFFQAMGWSFGAIEAFLVPLLCLLSVDSAAVSNTDEYGKKKVADPNKKEQELQLRQKDVNLNKQSNQRENLYMM